MGKHPHRTRKKGRPSADLLDLASTTLRKFRRLTNQVSKLSATQNGVGIALVAASLFYLVKRPALTPPAAKRADLRRIPSSADLAYLPAAPEPAGSAPAAEPQKPKRKKARDT